MKSKGVVEGKSSQLCWHRKPKPEPSKLG